VPAKTTLSKIGEFSKLALNGTTLSGNGTAINISKGTTTGTNTIQYNVIDDINYDGIMWRGVANVQYNKITNTCAWKSDGGGIYTANSEATGSVVSYNIVDGVLGNQDGGTTGRDLGEGIYLDEGARGVTVQFNTVLNCSNSGIFAHKMYSHTISNNTVYNCRLRLNWCLCIANLRRRRCRFATLRNRGMSNRGRCMF